jgi:Flp pilus assembly protein TadD
MKFSEEGTHPMHTSHIRRSILPLGLAGAIALAMVAGAGFSSGAVAKSSTDKAAAEAQKALAKGDVAKAIGLAEELVAADPRNTSYRALLAQSYLRAGRFESAATSFNDAMKLGDNSAKTALSLALADIGAGRNADAVAILNDWRDAVPAADLGLAYALAGDSGRGVAILSDALRGGDNSPKVRQNLAYAYALDGRWREARVMAAQDVPPEQLDARISDWVMKARPEDSKLRVAALLRVPMVADAGQPAALALNASGDQQQFAAETGAVKSAAPVVAAAVELPAAAAPVETLAQYQPVDAPVSAPAVAAAPPTPEAFSQAFNSTPVVQPLPQTGPEARTPAAPPARLAIAARPTTITHRPGLRPRHALAKVAGHGSSHLVQLGSFASEQGARRAWGHYAAKNPELRNFKMAITQATVRGKHFWRVAAAGLDGRGANSLCSAVKNRGGVCFAYAASRLMPGRAVNAPAMAQAKVTTSTRLAMKPMAAIGPVNARRH